MLVLQPCFSAKYGEWIYYWFKWVETPVHEQDQNRLLQIYKTCYLKIKQTKYHQFYKRSLHATSGAGFDR